MGVGLLFLAVVSGIFYVVFFNVIPTIYGDFRTGLGNSAKKYGLYVENVVVRGRVETPLEDIRGCLPNIQGTALLNLDMEEINKCILGLPWIKTVVISKRFPQDMEIFIQEKNPMALWQHNKIIHVVADDGSVVLEGVRDAFVGLPTIVGKGAPEHAPELFRGLNNHPKINDEVASSIRVSNRRWNLLMKNGITIRLPETDLSKALQQLDDFIAQYGLNAEEIKSIDFRIQGRLALSMTKEGIAKFQKNKKSNGKKENNHA